MVAKVASLPMLRAVSLCLVVALAAATAWAADAPPVAASAASYLGRPVYSEPGAGLQLPPGCRIEPTWRGRISNSDFEIWVVDCNGETRTWLLRRSTVEMLAANQARLRFLVTDERRWPGEIAGDTASVQCVGRSAPDAGFVVVGAKWRPAGAELRLTSATTVLRADPVTQKFVAATLAQVDCARHPEREAMMRRLQQR
jgi:hypothetical protein